MNPLSRGRYEVKLARTDAEVAAAQRLRYVAFWAERGRARDDGRDADAFDAAAQHMLVHNHLTGDLVACCRLQLFDGHTVDHSYAAQFYDLTRLARFPGPMLELGRFCLDSAHHDPDILRLAWAAIAAIVDQAGVGLLFGCTSFSGADPVCHAGALASLVPRIGPDAWRPGPRASDRVALTDLPPRGPGEGPPPPLPALLRTYLAIGGWVSDHAVIDRTLDTMHVLTCVEIAAIPPARARALRMIASDSMG